MHEGLDDRISAGDIVEYPIKIALVDPEFTYATKIRNAPKTELRRLLH